MDRVAAVSPFARAGGGLVVASAAVLFGTAVRAELGTTRAHVGDTYEITLIRHSSQQTGSASSASSSDQDVLVERVAAIRPDGVELEYDLPKQATAADRAVMWQLPVRVFKPFAGPLQLLNRPELERRADNWLRSAKLTRTACGHWYFTWDAFQIQCDPQSAIDLIEPFDLRIPDVRDGAAYSEPDAKGTATLSRQSTGPNGSTFTTQLQIDPDVVERAQAQSDVAVGEIIRKPVTFDAALEQRRRETVSGSISLTIETNSTGDVVRRTKVTRVQIKQADGHIETDIATETVTRRKVRRA